MVVAIDVRSLMVEQRTGVAQYVIGLLTALFAMDKDTTYLLFYNSRKSVRRLVELWDQPNIYYVPLRVPNKLLNTCLFLFKKPYLDQLILKLAKKQNPTLTAVDYIYFPNLHFFAVSNTCKVVLTIHDLSFFLYPECLTTKRRLWHLLLRPQTQCKRATHIFVPSKQTKQDLVRYYQVDQALVQVVYPGVPALSTVQSDSFSCVRQLPDQYVLYVGTVEPRKNIETLLRAFALYNKIYADTVTLVIAGATGWKNQRLCEQMKKQAQVVYIPNVSEWEKEKLYKQATVFVYPSLYEGFGFPILEAMRAGTPVITSDRSSLPEIAGKAAVYCNPHSVSSVYEVLERVLKSVEIREYYRVLGEGQWKQFQWDTMAQEFLAWFVQDQGLVKK